MTLRIDVTDEAGESIPWVPTGDVMIQVATVQGSKAYVEIQGRADMDAPWVSIVGTLASQEPLLTCVQLPQIKLVYRNNKSGQPLKAWSDA